MDTSSVTANGGWWLALAIVTAGLAETKGRRRWLWFVLGLFLGPIATALVVIWDRPVAAQATPTGRLG